MDAKSDSPTPIRRFLAAVATVFVVLAVSGAIQQLAGCDKDHAIESRSEDVAWRIAPRVFAGDLAEDELRKADWVRVEAIREGTVIAYAETTFSTRSVDLTIPTRGDVLLRISGYDDRNRSTLMWQGASDVASGSRDPIVALERKPGLIPVPRPRFSVDSGTFRGAVKVGIAADSSELDIHYTTDGGDPTPSSPRYSDSIVVERSMVLSAVAYRKGRALSEIVRAVIAVRKDTVSMPKFSETSGEYARVLKLALSCDTTDAVIRYTTDGTEPDANSQTYSGPIEIASDRVVKAFATKAGLVPSGIRAVEYVIRLPKLAAPRFAPEGGRFDSARTVAITADSGAVVHYTTVQGETPTGESPVYDRPLRVAQTTTVSAVAMMAGRTTSDVASQTYVIVPPGTVASPWAAPEGGTFKSAQTVVLKADTGAIIHCTLNGSEPDQFSPVCSTAIPVASDMTIRAVATMPGKTTSTVFAAVYRIRPDTVSAPRFSPDGRDTYEAGQEVVVATDTLGAVVRYTLDGSVPLETSPKYERPLVLDSAVTIRAVAFKQGLVPSAMVEASFQVRRIGALPEPVIEPFGGVFDDSQKVALRCDTADAEIRYTLDGSAPDTGSTLYAAPFTIRSSATLRAIALKTGRVSSNVAAAEFLINVAGKAESPRFSPNGGSFSGSKQVVLYTLDTSLAIRYTLDGSTPTAASALYSEPIEVSSSMTIKAVASKEGLVASDVKEATFTIEAKSLDTVKAPEMSPNGGSYVDRVAVGIASATGGAYIRYTIDGRDPDESSPLYTDSILLDTASTIKAIACRDGMVCSKTVSVTFAVQRRDTVAMPIFGVEGGTYMGAQSVQIKCGTDGAELHYTLDGRMPDAGSPVYKGTIAVDSSMVLLVVGFHDEMVSSPVAKAEYTILRKVAVPVFSLSAKDTLRSAAKLGLSCPTPGARIYYTLDGGEPDSAGKLYQDSLAVSSSQTVRAIAYVSGWLASDIASADYVYAELGTVTMPTIMPAGGLFVGSQSVSIASWGSTGSTTYYTLDGTDPVTSSTRKIYTGLFSVTTTTTVKAYTVESGMKDSPVRSATFTLTTRVATPSITPVAGTYSGTQTVTISCANSDAKIFYTLDGSKPTESSTVYAGSFTVSGSTVVTAFAVASGKISSLAASESIVILPKLAVPTYNIKAGTYTTIQKVVLSHALTGTTIYYTTDGTAPTTSSSKYADTITVSSSQTLTAMAVKSGYANSGTNSIALTINLPKIDTLTFSLGAGTYVGNQTLTITSPVSGATIYYTTDSTNPTNRSSVYSKALTISKNTLIKAIAMKTGYTPSDIKARSFAIRCWAPAFDTTAGSYSKVQSIAITSATSGAKVYYTIDGTTPSATNGKLYTTPVTVSYSQTLRAVAVLSGLTNSHVSSASYALTLWGSVNAPSAVTFSPTAGKQSGAIGVTLASSTGATIYYTTDWSEPTTSSTKYTGAIKVTDTTTIKARAYATVLGLTYGSAVSGASYLY